MTKERPTHLCSLEIDPRDPSAIIQALTDERDDLKAKLDQQQDLIRELEAIANKQVDQIKELESAKDPEEIKNLILENLGITVFHRREGTEAQIELTWAGKCFDFTHLNLR